MPADLERTFELSADRLRDLTFAGVRAWKQAQPGRKVVAYFPVYAPCELVDAAGMLPINIVGAGDGLDIQHADARFGSFICSIIKTTLELGMTNRLDFVDSFLFSSICDSARNLCWVLKRNFPEMNPDFLHLPHNPASESSVHFLEAEFRRLIGEFETLGGQRVSDDAIRQSIVLRNRQRALVRELYAFRESNPHRLRAWESYVAIRAGGLMPVEEHLVLLESVLRDVRQRTQKSRDSIRVVIEGAFCEQPPIELIRLLEEAGCDIVEDDFALAPRWFVSDVPEEGDPVHALAESYVHRSAYSSVRHDWRQPRSEGLAEKIRASRAEAVLFLIAKFCEPAYFDYVLFKKKVEELGLPYLQLEYEEKLFTFDRLRTEIETFVESLVFD